MAELSRSAGAEQTQSEGGPVRFTVTLRGAVGALQPRAQMPAADGGGQPGWQSWGLRASLTLPQWGWAADTATRGRAGLTPAPWSSRVQTLEEPCG